jgi:hypothetical protein
MQDVQVLPGADIDSDNNLLVAEICDILKKIISSKMENQDGIWKSYLLNDRKGKTA